MSDEEGGEFEGEAFATELKVIFPNLKCIQHIQLNMGGNRTVNQEKVRLLREHYIAGAATPEEYKMVMLNPVTKKQTVMLEQRPIVSYGADLANDTELYIKEISDARNEEGTDKQPQSFGVNIKRS